MRLSLGRKAYNHGNRLGWLGYGAKPNANVIAPSDNRAFRDIKLSEIPAWLNGRPKDPIYLYFAARRYVIAWRFKYSRPGIVPLGGENVGQYGFPHNAQLSGSALAQLVIGIFLFMQLVVCYKENRDHEFKKYHDYPISETLMAYLPLNYKQEDIGGKVAWSGVAVDGFIAALIVNAATAGNGAPTAAMGAARVQAGMKALVGIAAILMLGKMTHSDKGADVVKNSTPAELANLLGCDVSEVNEVIAKNEKMGNALRYSMFTNMFVRLFDAVTGSF